MRYWWSFSVKYFCSYILWHIFMYGLISDLQGKSYLTWEILKWVYVAICPIIVIVFFILDLKKETFEKQFVEDDTERSMDKKSEKNELSESAVVKSVSTVTVHYPTNTKIVPDMNLDNSN